MTATKRLTLFFKLVLSQNICKRIMFVSFPINGLIDGFHSGLVDFKGKDWASSCDFPAKHFGLAKTKVNEMLQQNISFISHLILPYTNVSTTDYFSFKSYGFACL